MRFTASEAAAALGAPMIGDDVVLDGMSFDSRELRLGQLFVPIVGDRDGHDFLDDAVRAGAGAYLTSGPTVAGPVAIPVADTGRALLDLARWARYRLPDRVIGITGSVGKTSVKDLTARVLAQSLRTAANVRSYNNEQGLPHTVLNAPDDTEALVVEMGMRGFGEIALLCEIARPTIGVVVTVAPAHTERVGGIEGVARAKAELVESLSAHGTAILNADQPLVAAMRARTAAEVVTFGLAGDVRVTELELDEVARASFVLATPWGTAAIRLGVSGAHMATNAAAAAAVGLVNGLSLESVATGLEQATLSPWRMEVRTARSGATIINDAYNANPFSMAAALETLAALPAARRIAVVGVMAELADPIQDHREIARLAASLGIELVAVGTDAYGIPPILDVPTTLGPLDAVTAVLVKGSRVAGLEAVAARLLDAE